GTEPGLEPHQEAGPDTGPEAAVSAGAGLPMVAPRREPRVRRPWWAKLLGAVVNPWLTLRIEPQAPPDLVDGRPVCYVLEDYGLSNALILERACREAGLPSP